MIELLVGLGIIILVIWAIVGVIFMFSPDELDSLGWWAIAVMFPWIAGILFLIGLFSYHVGKAVLGG